MSKPTGPHKANRLSPMKCNNAPAGRHADGKGLYLVVEKSLSKHWVLRIMVRKKRTDIGLGSYPDVSIKEAREKASEMRKIARGGGDPLAERRKAQRVIPTFAEMAYEAHEFRFEGDEGGNAKHKAQWINTLKHHAFPLIGDLPVNKIEHRDVVAVLNPIWKRKPETARRLTGRIREVLNRAKGQGYRDEPFIMSEVTDAFPKKKEKVRKHHPAMPWHELPAFITRLRDKQGLTSATLALEFTILTAARSGMVRHLLWRDLDLEHPQGPLWIIPAEKMKNKKIHRVPLAPQALDVLDRARTYLPDSDYCFPGQRNGKSLSENGIANVLKRLSIPYTVHGFRTTFRVWASEETSHPHAAGERALAHTIPNSAEAAYHRTDLLDKRRLLMNEWAEFVHSGLDSPRVSA